MLIAKLQPKRDEEFSRFFTLDAVTVARRLYTRTTTANSSEHFRTIISKPRGFGEWFLFNAAYYNPIFDFTQRLTLCVHDYRIFIRCHAFHPVTIISLIILSHQTYKTYIYRLVVTRDGKAKKWAERTSF